VLVQKVNDAIETITHAQTIGQAGGGSGSGSGSGSGGWFRRAYRLLGYHYDV
jgi:hypothetical protein